MAVDEASFRNIRVQHGDTISYVISNKLRAAPVHLHMLSLNASWSIGTLLWNARIPPMGERSGDITMVIPRKINDNDEDAIEDTIIVIFCVGEQSADRFRSVAEWLRRIYLPPVVLSPGRRSQSVPTWLPFVPPPNCQVRQFTIKTAPRDNGSNQ